MSHIQKVKGEVLLHFLEICCVFQRSGLEYNAFEVMVLYIPLSSRTNVKCKKWLILLGISVLFQVKITKKIIN